MARPRKAEGRETRRDILDRALDLFSEYGVAGTSMRQIARAVGVRESALYHHFASKAAIFEGLLGELGPGLAAQLLQVDVGAVVEALGGEGTLRHLVEAMLTAWSMPREQKFLRLMMSEGPRLIEEGVIHPAANIKRAREGLARVFHELGKRHLIAPVDPHVTTLAFLGPLVALRVFYLVVAVGPPDYKGLRVEANRFLAHFWSTIRPRARRAS